MHKGLVAIVIQHEKPLIQQYVDRLSAGAVDHELSTGLPKDRSRIVDELPSVALDPQIDATLSISHCSALIERYVISTCRG